MDAEQNVAELLTRWAAELAEHRAQGHHTIANEKRAWLFSAAIVLGKLGQHDLSGIARRALMADLAAHNREKQT